jgi:hypothetical protein
MELLLTLVLLSGFLLHDSTSEISSGILEPGGVFTGIDGVKIDARRATLDQPLEVFIERVEDTRDLPPLATSRTPVTPYYRVGATERYREQEGILILRLPLPEGTSPEGMGVMFLVPGDKIMVDPPTDLELADSWFSAPVSYDAETNEIAFEQLTLLPEGTVFIIVPDIYGRP